MNREETAARLRQRQRDIMAREGRAMRKDTLKVVQTKSEKGND